MPDGLLEVGRITKAHGLGGEVVVLLLSDSDERVAPGATFETSLGTLTVTSSRRHQGRRLVRFEGCTDRAQAEALRGLELRGEPLEIEGAIWAHELIGAAVELLDGTPVGTIEAIEDNPASDLLVLDGGGLVPLTFVTSIDPGVLVVIDPPEGLLG